MNVRSKYVGVALLCALIVAFESVAIEGALNISGLNLFLVSSVPSIVAGSALMSVRPSRTREFLTGLGRRRWALMIIMCIFVAAGVLMWFDAVSRIGAGEEAILGGGSSEVLFVVILSAIFLSERLNVLESVGSLMVVAGVFIVLTDVNDAKLALGFGEAEAILSSLCLGISVVMTVVLLRGTNVTSLSGLELLLSGLMVLGFGFVTGQIEAPDTTGLLILLGLGLFPALGLLTYNAGLPKIGASLVSVLYSLNGIMTVGVQASILLFNPDAEIMLPSNVALALLGGAVAFIGVYLIHKKNINFGLAGMSGASSK
jgi:drug/metabolite transporter (DMT)-like permease